ncbi:histone-lysine N-methyltransferase setd3-like [Selaginella moellendorffii]|uniref:histone-lysine N-methyltransferase setd3-like n=1 Tax=Selaginella moellendorffii TaxID=88036 RepID=UPI000D1CBBEF|nr:histone-lysine N-methyltransferase setd3-like [Selaginella moellendorffii]|eukprot:XP_024523831.1 histone-lysine N-methyltransferase setd3-like [Selaginella moellendorffii]
MFASRPIRAGERMLEVPPSLMITSRCLQDEVARFLPAQATEWSRLALFILAQWNKGQNSAWDPYMGILPSLVELNNTVFWKQEELQCVRHSPVYFKTTQRERWLDMEFSDVQSAISRCRHIFGETASYDAFKHAYSIVATRSWRVTDICELGMVPYVDLINHDWKCESILSHDPDKNCVVVIADRDYATGDEVFISYGQLPNVTLAVDYGFALSYNPFDEAEIWVTISPDDPLYDAKLDVFSRNKIKITEEEDGSMGKAFVIQDINSNPNGIPPGLRSFARVLCAKTPEELERLDASSAGSGNFSWDQDNQHKDRCALLEILSQVDNLIEKYVAADLAGDVHGIVHEPRREMAKNPKL